MARGSKANMCAIVPLSHVQIAHFSPPVSEEGHFSMIAIGIVVLLLSASGDASDLLEAYSCPGAEDIKVDGECVSVTRERLQGLSCQWTCVGSLPAQSLA